MHETSQLTVREVLGLPVFRRGLPEVVSGLDRLDRPVRWAHVLGGSSVTDGLRGGELVLAGSTTIGTDTGTQRALVRELSHQHAAALAVEVGSARRHALPDVMVEEAGARGLPLVALHRRVRFVEVTEVVHGVLMDRRFALLRDGEQARTRLDRLALQGSGLPEFLAELARMIGNPVVLEDAARQLVAHGLHRAPEDVTLKAWSERPRHGGSSGALLQEVAVDGAVWGRLVALELDGPLDEFTAVALGHAAVGVAIQLLRTGPSERPGDSARGGFLAELTRGDLEEAAAVQRATAFGFPHRHGALLPMVVRRRAGGCQAAVLPAFRDLPGVTTGAVLGGPSGENLLLVADIGLREANDELLEAVAGEVGAALARCGVPSRAVALAIGAPAPGWVEAGHTLRKVAGVAARAALEPPRPWHDARRSHVCDLLFALRNIPELVSFVDERLAPLQDGGGRRRVLLETLETYLAKGGRKTEVARALHLERQSLYHRLARIEQLLGVDLGDGDELLGLHLAVRAQRLLDGTHAATAHHG